MQRASNAATDTYTNTNTAALELMGNKKICVYEATSVADKRHLCGTAAAKKLCETPDALDASTRPDVNHGLTETTPRVSRRVATSWAARSFSVHQPALVVVKSKT